MRTLRKTLTKIISRTSRGLESESSTLRFCHVLSKKNIEACVIYRTLRKKACVKTLEHPNKHPKWQVSKVYLKRSIGTQRKLKKRGLSGGLKIK